MLGAKRTFKIIQKVPETYTGKARNKELQKTATFDPEYQHKIKRQLTWKITFHVP